jgi:hypothetical protein
LKRSVPRELSLELGLDEPDDPAALRRRAARCLRIDEAELPPIELLRRSLDARGGRIRFRLLLGVGETRGGSVGPPLGEVRGPPRVIVVGAGPAGLFCAWQLARERIASVVVERGKRVQPRRRDLKGLNRKGLVDPDSNYCFGEGGAGTYSDGKLYTRSHKRGSTRDVLEILVACGAPPEILVDARPHIGSNRLPDVVSSLRQRLEAAGVSFRFGERVVGLPTRGGRVRGVRLASGESLDADAVVVAAGHCARDVLAMLLEAGVRLEPKPFALGVRIEHPQPLVDRIQYGAAAGHPRLPAAAYRLATAIDGRGVYSFCMCPGGFIVPATTEPDAVVTNGMSLSRRDSPFANAGLVAALEPDELARAGLTGPLGGVELQRRLEQAAFRAGGGGLRAPATRATDFVQRRGSSTTPRSSYQPGLFATDVAQVLDSAGLPIAARLRAALRRFERALPGFLTEEAVLVGVESRTSSPVRVPRDPATLESPDLAGLYPAGEGGGWAGGIVSAAVDGMRVARAIAARRLGRP